MLLSSRTRTITELILNSRNYLTVEEISRKIGVSARTVYRELPEIERLMAEFGLKLESVSKKGLLVCGDKREIRKFLAGQDEVFLVEPEQRISYMLLYLLHQTDYIKTEAVALDHRYALSTVRGDLARMKEKAEEYGLRLLQQKGQGVIVSGTTPDKNRLTAEILLSQVEETRLYEWLEGKKGFYDPFLARMEEYGCRGIMEQTHRCLKKSLERSGEDGKQEELWKGIKTRDYLESALLLSLMVRCHGSAHQYHRYLEAPLKERKLDQTSVCICKRLEQEFQIACTEEEQSYIRWVVLVELGEEKGASEAERGCVNDDAFRFIRYVEERMGISLLKDSELREGFMAHLDKALIRIRSDMQISNPALSEIRGDYQELFRVIQEGAVKVFPHDFFPEDEIGYLVLYFALALDKLAKKIFRVLIVCSGGMGSSKMLAHALEREVPEISIVKTTSIIAFEQENLEDYDLILSTIPLYIEEGAYLRVSPMLNKKEVLQIKEKIRNHKHSMLQRITVTEREKGKCKNENYGELLERIQRVSAMFLGLISRFQIYVWEKGRDSKETVDKFLPGEKLELLEEYTFIIPTTEILYHEAVLRGLSGPVLAVFRKKGHIKENFPEPQGEAEVAIFYPEELQAGEMKALRYLIEVILEDRDFLEQIRQGDQEGLKSWIGFRAKEYLAGLLRN